MNLKEERNNNTFYKSNAIFLQMEQQIKKRKKIIICQKNNMYLNQKLHDPIKTYKLFKLVNSISSKKIN